MWYVAKDAGIWVHLLVPRGENCLDVADHFPAQLLTGLPPITEFLSNGDVFFFFATDLFPEEILHAVPVHKLRRPKSPRSPGRFSRTEAGGWGEREEVPRAQPREGHSSPRGPHQRWQCARGGGRGDGDVLKLLYFERRAEPPLGGKAVLDTAIDLFVNDEAFPNVRHKVAAPLHLLDTDVSLVPGMRNSMRPKHTHRNPMLPKLDYQTSRDRERLPCPYHLRLDRCGT